MGVTSTPLGSIQCTVSLSRESLPLGLELAEPEHARGADPELVARDAHRRLGLAGLGLAPVRGRGLGEEREGEAVDALARLLLQEPARFEAPLGLLEVEDRVHAIAALLVELPDPVVGQGDLGVEQQRAAVGGDRLVVARELGQELRLAKRDARVVGLLGAGSGQNLHGARRVLGALAGLGQRERAGS